MDKNLYALKLKSLSDQINIMLMEAEGEEGAGKSGKAFQIIGDLIGPENIRKAKDMAGKTMSDIRKAWAKYAQTLIPGSGEIDAEYDAKSSFLKKVIYTLTGTAVAGVAVLKKYAEGATDRVKSLTGEAMGAANFKEFSKSVEALKKMSARQGILAKITSSEEAQKLAASNLAAMKKAYIGAGVALILVSVILMVIAGSAMDVVGSIKNAIQNFNVENLISAIGKALGMIVLAFPAVMGLALIVIAMKGFSDQGMAGKLASALFPVIKVVNVLVKQFVTLA